MIALLKAVASLLPFIVDLLSKWRKARETQEAVNTAINNEEVQNVRDAAEILAERRDRNVLADRLRDGSF